MPEQLLIEIKNVLIIFPASQIRQGLPVKFEVFQLNVI